MLGTTIIILLLTKQGNEKVIVDHFQTISECKLVGETIKQDGFIKLKNDKIFFEKAEIYCVKDVR